MIIQYTATQRIKFYYKTHSNVYRIFNSFLKTFLYRNTNLNKYKLAQIKKKNNILIFCSINIRTRNY